MDKEKIKKTTEEVVDKSVEALSKAGKATKKFCKKMGLRVVNVKSDFQIEEIYKKIGNMVYDKIKSGALSITTEEFDELVSQIDELKKSIDVNNETINQK